MILVDFSNVAISAIAGAERMGEVDTLSTQFLLGKIRGYNVDFRNKYGELVICADDRSWRYDVFPPYKGKRRMAATPPDKAEERKVRYRIINEVFDALDDSSPFRCVKVSGAEGDDVIAVLSRLPGKHIVISVDKDLSQLKSASVDIFNPITLAFKDNGPSFLRSMLLAGDVGDGIPNFLSDDTVLIDDGRRQTPLRKPVREAMMSAIDLILEIDELPEVKGISKKEMVANLKRNALLIDLTKIPDYVVQGITDSFDRQTGKTFDIVSMLIRLKAGRYISMAGDFRVNR